MSLSRGYGGTLGSLCDEKLLRDVILCLQSHHRCYERENALNPHTTGPPIPTLEYDRAPPDLESNHSSHPKPWTQHPDRLVIWQLTLANEYPSNCELGQTKLIGRPLEQFTWVKWAINTQALSINIWSQLSYPGAYIYLRCILRTPSSALHWASLVPCRSLKI